MAVAQRRSSGTLVNRNQLDYELGRRGISGKELAARAGLHESVISRARRHPIRPSTLRKIAAALLEFPVLEVVDLVVTAPQRELEPVDKLATSLS